MRLFPATWLVRVGVFRMATSRDPASESVAWMIRDDTLGGKAGDARRARQGLRVSLGQNVVAGCRGAMSNGPGPAADPAPAVVAGRRALVHGAPAGG